MDQHHAFGRSSLALRFILPRSRRTQWRKGIKQRQTQGNGTRTKKGASARGGLDDQGHFENSLPVKIGLRVKLNLFRAKHSALHNFVQKRPESMIVLRRAINNLLDRLSIRKLERTAGGVNHQLLGKIASQLIAIP
jgi:hypothetical protein